MELNVFRRILPTTNCLILLLIALLLQSHSHRPHDLRAALDAVFLTPFIARHKFHT